VPLAFKRFGARKTIVAPDGTQIAPDRSKATDRTLIKALARAWRWQKLLDDGAYGSIAEMADKERINRSSPAPSGSPCWRPTSSKPS
jgi:hypothetical protein